MTKSTIPLDRLPEDPHNRLFLFHALFLQSLFLYKQEYDQKLSNVEADLKLLANERAHLINETIQMDWDFLESGTGQV